MLNLSHQGTPDNSNASDAIEKRPQLEGGPSEYQLQREANIAENQKLLANLGLSEGGSSVIDSNKSSKTSKGKKGEKGKKYTFSLFCATSSYPTMV